jgi:hypothetical protein
MQRSECFGASKKKVNAMACNQVNASCNQVNALGASKKKVNAMACNQVNASCNQVNAVGASKKKSFETVTIVNCETIKFLYKK